MPVLSSGIVIFDHGAQGWNAPYSANFQLIHDTFVNMILAGVVPGTDAIVAVPAFDSSDFTDNSTGTPSTTIPDAGATYSQTTINDIHSSFADQHDKLRDDVQDLQDSYNDLLVKLRETTGVGILSD